MTFLLARNTEFPFSGMDESRVQMERKRSPKKITEYVVDRVRDHSAHFSLLFLATIRVRSAFSNYLQYQYLARAYVIKVT